MKNFFVLFAVAMATMLVSCNRVENAGSCGAVDLVSKTTKQGKRFGIRFGKETVLYPQFAYFGQGISDGTIYFSNDRKVCYLFNLWGEEVLTKRKSNGKELGFTPVPIVVKEEEFAHQIIDPAKRYFGDIFNRGDFYLFEIADGSYYALFDNVGHQVYGPVKYFHPGSSGYIYQDVKTEKIGAKAFQKIDISGGRYLITVDEQVLFNPEYDEIIEVLPSPGVYVWYARKGQQWSAKQITIYEGDTPTKIETVSVNSKLLNRIRNMQIQDKAKGRRDGIRTVLIPGQRIGTQEASVVFL